MMTALLLYAYSRGVYSSRRIERACEERVDFMAPTGMAKPDHSTICQFRVDHRKALEGKPEDKAQSNFTDADSRIMKTKDGYEQAYNGQARWTPTAR